MKLINDNLKKAGYFNTILIIGAIGVKVYSLTKVNTFVKIDSIVCIFALVFGLIYSLNGYKKDVAKYYKIFMYLYLVSSVLSLMAPLVEPILTTINIFVVTINVALLILVFALAFIKDLGVNKSTNIAMVILLLNIIKLLYNVANKITIPSGFANLVLPCISCVLVSAKYKDKESRGAK